MCRGKRRISRPGRIEAWEVAYLLELKTDADQSRYRAEAHRIIQELLAGAVIVGDVPLDDLRRALSDDEVSLDGER